MREFFTAAVAVAMMMMSTVADADVADDHGKRGVACASCHIEGVPSADNASEQPCIGCHTETPKGKTVTVDGHDVPNVHAGHFDVYECLQCHKGHKPSVSACSECHKSKLAVP